MPSLRHFLQVQRARTMYSPFGLAWLRARDRDTPAGSYRNAPWPTSTLAIKALRTVQHLWPRRRVAEGSSKSSPLTLQDFYADHPDVPDFSGFAASASGGPVIAVNGAVTAQSADILLAAIARVQAAWPDVSWRLDVETKPAWLAGALKISVQQPDKADTLPAITLSAPAAESDVDAFIAEALAAREAAR